MSEDTVLKLLRLHDAWQVFKQTHNLEDAKISCCDNTRELFVALDAFSEVLRKGLK